MNDTLTAGSAGAIRLPPVHCTLPRLTRHEADTVIAALEGILYAVVEARFPDPNDELGAYRPEPETGDIPF